MEQQPSSQSKIFKAVIVLVILAALGIGGYYLYLHYGGGGEDTSTPIHALSGPVPASTVAATTSTATTSAPTTMAPTNTSAPTTMAPTNTSAPTTMAATNTSAPTTMAATNTSAPTTMAPTNTPAPVPTSAAPNTPAPVPTSAAPKAEPTIVDLRNMVTECVKYGHENQMACTIASDFERRSQSTIGKYKSTAKRADFGLGCTVGVFMKPEFQNNVTQVDQTCRQLCEPLHGVCKTTIDTAPLRKAAGNFQITYPSVDLCTVPCDETGLPSKWPNTDNQDCYRGCVAGAQLMMV